MRLRVLSLSVRFFLAFSAFLICVAASAEPTTAPPVTTISISTGTDEVATLLQKGHELETQRRWGEATTLYEDAIRRYPGEDCLHQRFDLARLHYDLQRRYADRSFLDSMAKLPSDEAMALYSQVLLKIQAHYVHDTDWRSLVMHGTDSFQIALGEPAFFQRNVPQASRPAVDEFCCELRHALALRRIQSRQDAQDAVAFAAQLAMERLQVPTSAIVLEYLCGATNTLDPYSAYLTPNQLSEIHSQIDGNFVGLGIELKAKEEGLLIVRVIPGSPAQESGILTGDHVVSVDGRNTQGLTTDQAANLLQGLEGSVATLLVRTPPEEPRLLQLRRRRVEVPSIDGTCVLDRQDGIGYLKLVCFQKTTPRDLDRALWKLHDEGMRSLIIDLRGNPGGLLDTAIEVSDRFLQQGVIVSTHGRSLQEDCTYSAHTEGTWGVPLVVLIDRETASAAEIFAGAIQDHGRGTVVGARSYGKGSVQGIFPLSRSDAGLRLTTAAFYAPSGRSYNRIGVEPDVAVLLASGQNANSSAVAQRSDDITLAAAMQAAREIGRSRQALNTR